ncbi:MAG: tetratricopeptide repeat protein, partial [Sphingomonadales bacterium]
MSNFYEELKRRNVVRVGIAYLVMGWFVMQIVDVVAPTLELPDWFQKGILVLLLAGLPVALFFSWAFEITAQGLKKTAEVDADASISHSTGRKLDFVVIATLVLALGYFVWAKLGAELAAQDFVIIGALVLGLGYFIWDKFGADPAAQIVEVTAEAESDGPRSIAVLPFVNMSPDPDQEYFSDGITEEILNSLVKLEGLEVAGRTSSFAFKGENLDLRKIGEALGVSHIIEGSVRKAGVRIRITAQLVRADNGFHLWSETYDRELTDIFALQDEIAASIAKALKVELLGGAETTLTEAVNIEAYDHYLKGLQGMRVNSFEVLQAAEENFAAAHRIDPGFTAAYARRALAIWERVNTGALPLSALDLAEEVALEALAIEPDLSAAHVALALAANKKNGKEKAVRHTERALALGVADVQNLANLAMVLSGAGEFERANRLFQQALRLDPLNPLVHMRYGIVSNRQWGLVEQAERAFERTIELQPDNPNGWSLLGRLLGNKRGDVSAALPKLLKAESLDRRDPDYAYEIAFAYMALGDGKETEHWADRTVKIGPDIGVAVAIKVRQLIFAGREDAALDLGRSTLAREGILYRWGSKSILAASLAGIYMRRGEWKAAEEIVLLGFPRITEFPNKPTASNFEVRDGPEFSIMTNRVLAEIYAQSGQAEKATILNAHMDFITAEKML